MPDGSEGEVTACAHRHEKPPSMQVGELSLKKKTKQKKKKRRGYEIRRGRQNGSNAEQSTAVQWINGYMNECMDV